MYFLHFTLQDLPDNGHPVWPKHTAIQHSEIW